MNADLLRSRCLKLAATFLQQPAAPGFEERPAAFIRAFAARRRALSCTKDRAGNLLLRYPARGDRGKPLVLVAHMDHPGFQVESVAGREVALRFLGFVASPHARSGQRIRLFRRGEGRSCGAARLTRVAYERGCLAQVEAQVVSGTAAEAAYAMWDLPPYAVRGGRIVARNCDDAIGCVAALCVLDEMARRQPRGISLNVLFTRAEEAGFLGALEAIRLRTVPRDAVIVSLEASKALPGAPQGGGVIVRVGDRESTFDPSVTLALQAAASALAKKEPTFRWQRKLLDGGTCEATPFCLAGYRASGLAVALGNYHNQAVTCGRPDIAAENILVSDLIDEIRLLVAFTRAANERLHPILPLRERMRELARKARIALGA